MGFADSAVSPWFATATMNAPEMRHALGALVAHHPESTLSAETGVIPAANDPFALTSVGTSSAPAWQVGPGQAVVQRASGGVYVGTWDQPQTVAVDLPLPSSGQSRRDLLVAEVLDSEADSGDTAPTTRFRLRTIAGSASSSPFTPDAPVGTVPLWAWTVAANGALTGVNTVRPWTRAVGGVRFVEPGDTRAGSFVGDLRIFATGQVDAWLYIGSAWKWVTIVAATTWTQQTASLRGLGPTSPGEFGLGSNGSKIVRWKRAGNDLTVSYAFRWGSQPWTSPGGNVATSLPNGWVTPTSRDHWIPCQLWVNDPGSKVVLDYCGMALIQAGSNTVRPYFPRSNGSGGFATGILPYRVATGAGPGNSIPYIAGGYAYGGTLHIGPATIELAA